MSRRRSLGVLIDTGLVIYVQTRKHTAGSPADTIVEILSPYQLLKDFTRTHNATKADQITCDRTFWKGGCVTDRAAKKRGVRAKASPANQQSISLQRSVDFN
ncbi:hypothetical protein ACTXT7_002355 [Hymenolepis weldensis]